MAKGKGNVASLNSGDMEGHGENSSQPSIGKGTLTVVGTAVPLSDTTYSPNKKSGTMSGTSEQ